MDKYFRIEQAAQKEIQRTESQIKEIKKEASVIDRDLRFRKD